MLRKLPFRATSCRHDFQYYSVYYGEPFLFEEYLYYFDGRDLYVTGYDTKGNAIERRALEALLIHCGDWGVRSVVLESPSLVSLGPEFRSFTREIANRPNHDCEFEILLTGDLQLNKERNRSIRRSCRSGLTVRRRHANVMFSSQHYLLIERFVRRFESPPYSMAEFVAALFYQLSRPKGLVMDCFLGHKLVGFAIGVVVQKLGIIHATITAGYPNGVSDLLYKATIEQLRKLGAEDVTFGFSFSRGLLRFKEKWGDKRTWRGGYEIHWNNGVQVPDNLWATRMARRS